VTGNPNWLCGLPFAVSEHVFDEHGMRGCMLTVDDYD